MDTRDMEDQIFHDRLDLGGRKTRDQAVVASMLIIRYFFVNQLWKTRNQRVFNGEYVTPSVDSVEHQSLEILITLRLYPIL